MQKSASIRDAREGAAPGTRAKRLYRILYDSEGTNELPGDRISTEKQVKTMDVQGNNVWNAFGETFNFYWEQYNRNSIDDFGMSMVGSIHFDDELVTTLPCINVFPC